MKKIQFIIAANVIERIIDAGTYAKTMYKLKTLREEMAVTACNMIKEEIDILEKSGGIIGDDGRISFADDKSEADFQNAIARRNAEEIEISIQPIELDVDEISDVKITGEEFDALASGFIKFIM